RRKRLWRLPLSLLRLLRQVWRRAPGILRVAFLGLHLLLALSVIIFHTALPQHISWLGALFFTLTIFTTLRFGDFNLSHAPWWLKLYGCGVMAAGALLVAILFGLITDYIVSARVNQALGRQRVHLTDHIVVIGLGDVGTRVAEALRRIGEPVV